MNGSSPQRWSPRTRTRPIFNHYGFPRAQLRPSSYCGKEGGKGERGGERRGERGRKGRGREGGRQGLTKNGVRTENLRPGECSRAFSATCSSSWGQRGRGVCRGQAAPVKGRRQTPGKPGRYLPKSHPEEGDHTLSMRAWKLASVLYCPYFILTSLYSYLTVRKLHSVQFSPHNPM